jgi:hypothetical protein
MTNKYQAVANIRMAIDRCQMDNLVELFISTQEHLARFYVFGSGAIISGLLEDVAEEVEKLNTKNEFWEYLHSDKVVPNETLLYYNWDKKI